MAKTIQKLNRGQAPSLINADKGNELISAINALLESGTTQKAELAGITLKVTEGGRLELDISQEAQEILNPDPTEEPESVTQPSKGGLPPGFAQEQFTTIVNGIATTKTFLTR